MPLVHRRPVTELQRGPLAWTDVGRGRRAARGVDCARPLGEYRHTVRRHAEKKVNMSRVMADCRRFESDNNCSLTIMGEPDEVVAAAAAHAVGAHGHADTPELHEQLSAMLEPASAYAEERVAEPFPA